VEEQASLDGKAKEAFKGAIDVAFAVWSLLEIDPGLSDGEGDKFHGKISARTANLLSWIR